MPYVKLMVILFAVSTLLAVALRLLFFLVARLGGGAAIGATNAGWVILLFAWWTTSFIVGVRLAMMLRVFPFSFVK